MRPWQTRSTSNQVDVRVNREDSASCDPASAEITWPKRIAEAKDVVVDSMGSSATDLAAGLEQIESAAPTLLEEGGDADDLEIRTIPGSDEEDSTSIEPELSSGSSCSVISDGSSASCAMDELSISDSSCEMGTATSMDAEDNLGEIVPAPALSDFAANSLNSHSVVGPTNVEPEAPGKHLSGSGKGSQNAYLRENLPLWGCITICGRSPDMEDAVVVVPKFFEVPLQTLIGDQAMDGFDPSSISLPCNFFGVYDGHGGAQVANYCRERLHHLLIELLTDLISNNGGKGCSDWRKLWEKAFFACFQNIDDEVGGKASSRNMGSTTDAFDEGDHHQALSEPVAAETVGSTAVVAVVCSSHIIVANCGDSRAVLCRGKKHIPLSVDHKPDREDEYLRIESQGGKVIHWNGHRVSGVLAMSRSIGDRYLKPWIIPEPEVTITARARDDECLVLASDGLWDVMSNEEVCDVARKQILLWHKRNGPTPISPSSSSSSSSQRGTGADPAAQAAADRLTRLASQRGSQDNITIVVVDLKAQRKFKSKS